MWDRITLGDLDDEKEFQKLETLSRNLVKEIATSRSLAMFKLAVMRVENHRFQAYFT
jgi:hypothetical protein